MEKLLLLIALLANLFLLATSSGSVSKSTSISYSSSSSGSSSSSVSSFTSSGSHQPGSNTPCDPSQPPSCHCKKDEIWSNCPVAVCVPKTCKEIGFPVACPDLKPDGKCPVKPACICKEGYVRNSSHVCIPMEECPSCGGDCNAKYCCGKNCNKLCSNYKEKPGECLPCLYNSCECKRGFVFDEIKGKCVLPCDCTVCKGLNEMYDPCPAPCPPQRCDVNIALILCEVPPKLGDPACKPGCRCIDDYVKNNTGVCIPRDQCPTCPKPNEVYDPCIAPCPPRRCDVDDRVIKCARPNPEDPCEAGCRCADGYHRNGHGICVTREECPSCYGPNEHYDCGVACDNVCATLHKQNQTHCPIHTLLCTNMCYCDEGYARDSYNVCIPIENCQVHKCKGKHEVYNECMQGDCRPKNCSQLGISIACPRIDPKYCKKGCICKDGYVRDKHDECIPSDQCPSCGGDPNAQSGCGNNCGRLCSNYDSEDEVLCTLECKINGCDCKKHYVYDSNTKKCVLPKDCTPVCNKDEVYSACINGGCKMKNCSQIDQPVPCIKMDPKYCIKGCLCKDGYLRNDKDICVPKGDCKPPVCRQDEVYSECVNKACPVRNCSLVGRTVNCLEIDPKHCIKGCLCKDPLMRENDGSCVPIAKCRSPVCNKDEVYSECINGGCTRKNCSQIDQPVPCIKMDPKYCIKGCLCKDGYLRNDKGICVPKGDCKPHCNQPNEYYEPCDLGCPPQTCESLNRSYACPIRNDDTCKGRCKCKKGYYRNKLRQCITEEQCRRCMGPHEYYSCGGACDNVCKTLLKQNQTNCSIKNIKCTEMCYCENGYARAKNGTCIPIKCCKEPQCEKYEKYETCPAWNCEPQKCSEVECPKPCQNEQDCEKCPVKPACICIKGYVRNDTGQCIPIKECPGTCNGKHEVYEDCENPSCTPMKCSEVGFPLNCTDPPSCKKGCICKHGYVRDHKDICIPIKNCPSCKGDKNAEYGCGVNCLKKCYDLQNPDNPKPCRKICKINGCDCKKNYYFDENTNTCVLPKDCTPTCSENEVYDPCINGGCGHRNCSQLGEPILCIDPIKCRGGCTCKKGYLRVDETGECVPRNKCPDACSKPNEEYVDCPQTCPPQTCNSINKTYHCPMIKIDPSDCEGDCRCKEGYYRNLIGECIRKKDCLKCTGDHEYFSCGQECDNVCCDLKTQSKDNCPFKNKKCVRKCYCEDGYARNKDDDCIPIHECPESCNKPNEEYVECPQSCPPETCESINKTYHCPMIKKDPSDCEGACRCKKGYYRNLIGECIRKKDCLKCTRDHEYFSCGPECDNVCCDLDTQTKDNCPIKNIQCVRKCYCEDGYARNKDCDCIPIDECPEREPTVNGTVALAKLQNGNTKFTFEVLCQLLHARPGENFMFSTISILTALAQIALYAVGTAAEQLFALLNLDSKEEIRTAFPLLIESYKDQKDVILYLAIKYYGNINTQFSKGFKKDAVKVFNSDSQSIDFSKNKQAAYDINAWISDNTNGTIKNLVSPDMFSALTQVAIFNCMYFKGNWVHQFNPDNTESSDFYINDNETVQVNMMYQQNSFLYGENDDLDCQILELPYKGGELSLTIFLPRSITGLKSLAKKLRVIDCFAKIKESLQKKKVKVYVPLIDMVTNISNMEEILKMNNVTKIFESDGNEIQGILEDDIPLVITDAIQKTVFKCDETGSEAAAATGVIISARSQPQPSTVYTFKANRSFAFVLYHADSILFTGVFCK